MFCYNYDATTNEYLSSTECVLDPLETEQQGIDVWMLPANATFTEPPAAQKGFARVWQKVKWVQVEDHRGTRYWLPGDTWDSEPREMKDLGTLPNDYMLTAPSKPLEEARTDKLTELSQKHHEAEEGGILQSSLGFPVDVNTRANRDVSGLISQMEMTSVTTAQFCDANNAFHEVTLDNLKVLQLELIQYAQSLYATKWQLRAAIEAAKTADELNAIDIKFVTDFTPTPVVLTPDTPTSGAVIDEKTSGPAIARALEWVGGTPDALTAGALDGLAKSGYSTSEDATMMLGSGYTAWCHEFTGTGDVIQTMPNITNERDGFLLFIRNSKTTGNVTLNPGGLGDTLDGKSSYVVAPGHSVFMLSCDAQSRWVVIYETGQHKSMKPLYIESAAPVTIPDGWHRVVLAFQSNSDGTITQTLPDLTKTILGAHMQIRNLRTDGGIVELLPTDGQLLDGVPTPYTIEAGTDVFLLAEGNNWFVWQTVSHNTPQSKPLRMDNADVDVLDVQYPLEVKVDADTNTATLDINPSAYQPMMAPGIYATLSDDVSVTNRFYNNPRAGKIFCDEVIFPGDPFLRLSPMTKGLTIQDVSTTDDPNVTGGTAFVVVAHVAFDQIANEDFDIDVRLWSQKQGYPEEDILTDVNGRVMATTVSVKAGEKIKDIVLEGIVMAKEVQDIGIAIRHNAKNDVLQLGGRVRGGTCLVAQAVTPNNHTGIALQAYERDFNKTILFEKKYFRELAALKYWLNTPQQETTITAGEGIEESSGWGLNNITPLKVAITPERVFSLASTGTDLADYFVGWTANALDTQALLGKSVTVSYFGSNIDSAYNIVLLKWTKKGTPAASQKMVSRNNDTIVWTDGWELADSYFIAENPSGDYQNSVTTFTVPDDAYQFAIGIVPVMAQAPSTLRLKNLFITVNEPFSTFEMLSNDVYKARITNQATFAQDRESFDALRYTINDTFSAMPAGKLVSGTAAITVDNTKNNIPGSVIAKDGGVYVLGADMKVTINMKALLANEKSTDSTVDFSVFTFDKDGKGQEIPNCTLRFKVAANTQPTLVSGAFPSFSGAKDSTFAIMMKSDKTDGAYLQTVNAQPLLSLKMVTA